MNRLRLSCHIAVAVLVAPVYRRARRRPLLLVGGHEGELFEDNSRAMYHYLRRHQPRYDVYWVMNGGSPHWDEVDRPVRRGSLRALVYFLVAEGGFYSHTASDLAPGLHRLLRRPHLVRVHLGHGIVGLKITRLRGTHHKRLGPDADLWVSLSQFERDVRVNTWRLPADQVKITGHPRYDEFPRFSETRREIVYIPTWRDWLYGLDEADFRASDFFRDIDRLTTSPDLHALLQEHDLDLVVHLHFYLHGYFDCFTGSDRIRFAPIESEIREALQYGRVLVTDYSSVAFDFSFHLGKPVVFHQPDVATFLAERGSHLDMPGDLFGPQSRTPEELVAHLRHAVESPEQAVAEYEPLRARYFAFDDTNNSARVFREFEVARDAGFAAQGRLVSLFATATQRSRESGR